MLRELAVSNLAVIDDLCMDLGPGFLAITGETGAGKSLLLGALGLLLGDRGSAELIRAGKDELRVTGRFDLERNEQQAVVKSILDIELDEPELILSRRLNRTGRSSAYANDQPVSVATLKRLGESLVDVHGQRESYALLQPAYQLDLLDLSGKLIDVRRKYEGIAEELRSLRSRYQELAAAKQTRQRELALIRFERDELDGAKLIAGEQERLERERDRLANAQSLSEFASRIATRLVDDDEEPMAAAIGRLAKDGQHWARLDPKLAEAVQRLTAMKAEIQDLGETARDLAERFEADPARLDEVEKRLQLLATLETKYGRPIADLIVYRDSLTERERSLLGDETDLAGMDRAIRGTFASLFDAAMTLRKGRAKAAKKLAVAVQSQLNDLQMPHAVLTAELTEIDPGRDPIAAEVPAAGFDHFEFLLAANPGEPARPLRKVASGGELSRTMLAIKTVLAAHDPVRTLVVFDEIDANVGGRLGDVLGKKLSTLGESHQVICVTHLPQVAGYASRHWTIRKKSTGKSTVTTITELDQPDDRIEELAAMLRGDARSASTRAEAKAMLKSGAKSG